MGSVISITFQALGHLLLGTYFGFMNMIRDVFHEHFSKDISLDIALVTGGGSGIGRLLAVKLAQKGAVVVTVDVNDKGNQETVDIIREAGGRAHSFSCDLRRKEDIYDMANRVSSQVGDISILVNNAGVVSGSSILETSDDMVRTTFDVNVLAHYWTLKAFLPNMIQKKRGHIVTVASMAGLAGVNKLTDYCSSKYAAVGLDDSLRVELHCAGLGDCIQTTCVCPYFINTGMFEGVRSKVVPILEPEFVVDEIVKAVLINKEYVLLPWWCGIIVTLKTIIPVRTSLKFNQLFGFTCSMDQFIGRNKQE